MTRRRKHSLRHYAVAVPRQIFQHPDPLPVKLRRLGAALIYQARKRLGRPPAVVDAGPGLRVVGTHDAGGVSNLVYFGRYFEYDEIHFLEAFLRPGDRFVDGGANIGLISLIASGLVGSEGHVVAFEPSAQTSARMQQNLALNEVENVTVHIAALGAEAGQMRFSTGWDVSNALVAADHASADTELVDVVALDEVLEPGPYALTKLDLEGGELAALRGASSLLASGQLATLLVEAFEHQLARLGDRRDDLLDLLRSHGYSFHHYRASDRRLIDDDPPARGNFLAIHHDARAMVDQRLAQRR
ncbi:MAG: FkbM family methyltransferase [Acidimicrobiales bacterium]|nr:FkbM family methyltransferase [Acidimicrobiales bacterium]